MANNMKNKLKYIPTTILTLTTVFAGGVLSSTYVSADTTGSKPISVTVGPACTFDADTSYTATISIAAGEETTTESAVAKPSATITCGTAGFSVQAVGFSPDSTHPTGNEGNTSLYGGAAGSIATGTSGPNSYWAMKVSSATSATSTVTNLYSSYSVVPSSLTNIVTFGSAVSGSTTGSFRADYKVYASASQAPGTYSGAVKYILVEAS